jgi:hypothetical protein
MASLADTSPKTWGPHYWRTIAHMVNAYPVSNPSESLQAATEAFFESLAELLPCQECRDHYTEWLDGHPIAEVVRERKALADWVSKMKQNMPGGTRSARAASLESQQLQAQRQPISIRELRLQAQRRLANPQSSRARSLATPTALRTAPRAKAPPTASVRAVPRHRTATNVKKGGCNCNNK